MPALRLALLRAPALSRNALCPLAIVVLFPPEIAAQCQPAIVVRCPRVIAPAVPVPASQCGQISPCVRNKGDQAGKVVLILRVPPDPVALVVRKIVLTASDPAQLLPARVLVHASPVGPACFQLLRQTKCRRGPSLASRSTRAVLRSASAPEPINARWKGSASSTQLVNAPVQVIADP